MNYSITIIKSWMNDWDLIAPIQIDFVMHNKGQFKAKYGNYPTADASSHAKALDKLKVKISYLVCSKQTNERCKELQKTLKQHFQKHPDVRIVEESPIKDLYVFHHDHRRLKVFIEKGCVCQCCGRVGTRLIYHKKRNEYHWDLFTDDLVMMTVDHIIPRAKGGSNRMENLQCLCQPCNFEKLDKSITNEELRGIIDAKKRGSNELS